MHNASHKRRVNVVPFGHFYLKAAKTRGLSGTAPYEPLRRRRRAHPRPRAGCVGRSGERTAGRIGGCHAYWSARSSSS